MARSKVVDAPHMMNRHLIGRNHMTDQDRSLTAIQSRARVGYIGADSIEMTDLITVEVRGDGDQPGTVWHGEVILTRESAGYAIWALAKSMGLDEEAETMLKAAGVEGF